MLFIRHNMWLLIFLSLSVSAACAQDTQSQAGESKQVKPFKLEVEQKDFFNPPPPANYVTPQMMPGMPNYAPAPVNQPLNAGIQQQGPPPQQQMQQQTPQMGYLPPQFLGRWQVMGSRAKVEAQPQFQAGMDSIFSMNTQNVWNIQGNAQQGYMLNNDQGVSTSLLVQSTGDTAILRYQHPIKNTVAQEAVVMQLLPGGASFNGIERISIVKQGEGVRAKVEYNLLGRRQ